MTIETLIEKLQSLAKEHPGATVYSMYGAESEPCEPEPEYRNWGNEQDPDRGVYL